MRRGTGVFEEGTPSDRIFFLSSGLVKLMRADSGRTVLVGIVRPGELFGDQDFFSGDLRESRAEVLTDAEVFSIPREAFMRALEESPDLWREVALQLANRTRSLERQVELVTLHSVEDRILLQLKDLAGQLGASPIPGFMAPVPLSQSELASLIGATRETTSMTLNQLRRRGLVQMKRRCLLIPVASAPAAVVAATQAA
ncbi:MAG: Crp/Fnr family transcriptional regulator [Acidobacteria bacterium]|nr:Crp/Fnr family transcriptional regulator [Acidobacteriota bacterium]